MPKTIRQIAETCGISSQYALKYIKKQGLENRLDKSGKAFLVPDDLAQEIIEHFTGTDEKETRTETDGTNDELVQVLKKQVEIQQKQIEELLEQNKALTVAVQDLTATNKALAQAEVKRMFAGVSRSNEIILADAQVLDTQQTTQEQAQPKQEKKRGFWARLFGLD